MSVKCGIFYGMAQGNHWLAWHNPMRSQDGVFIDVNRPFGPEDEWGYQEFEVTPWADEPYEPGARVRLFLPLEVCEAVAQWVAAQPKDKPAPPGLLENRDDYF